MTKNERTSAGIAHVAGQLLNGRNTAAAIEWLEGVVDNPGSTEEARGHAASLLGVLAGMRRVAASALTQR